MDTEQIRTELDEALARVNCNVNMYSNVSRYLDRETRARLIAAVIPVIEKCTKGEQQ